jgi:DNA-binding NarL/FixJ family response regulator
VIEHASAAAGCQGNDPRRHNTELPLEGQESLRILIADHQPAVRSAVGLLLNEKLGLDTVGEAADNQGLLAQLDDLQPDIILIDWELPGWSAADLFETLRGLDRQPGVIVLGTRPESARAALAAGADAFVSKSDPPKRLLTAIRALWAEGKHE